MSLSCSGQVVYFFQVDVFLRWDNLVTTGDSRNDAGAYFEIEHDSEFLSSNPLSPSGLGSCKSTSHTAKVLKTGPINP
jgi:hypothetical protein